MLIRIFASQIPSHWEAIKYAAVKVDEVDAEYRPAYLNQLLHDLLCSKAHCFIMTDDTKQRIRAVAVLGVTHDKIRNKDQLLLQMYYAFEKASADEWRNIRTIFSEFAEQEGCSEITFISRNPKAIELGKMLGFKEAYRRYNLSLGGDK